MNYNFDINIATKFGVNEAIFLQNMLFWIAKNEANERHYYKERYWTYNTTKALNKIFPFWTQRQIRTVIKNLIKHDLILCDKFNENPYDQTRWYAFTDFGKSILQNGNIDVTKMSNRQLQRLDGESSLETIDTIDLTKTSNVQVTETSNVQVTEMSNHINNRYKTSYIKTSDTKHIYKRKKDLQIDERVNEVVDHFDKLNRITTRKDTKHYEELAVNITEILREYKVDDLKKVFQWVKQSPNNWYKMNNFNTLTALCRPTKFGEKLEKALMPIEYKSSLEKTTYDISDVEFNPDGSVKW